MADLPSGTVTFLFTDIEGSTRLWEQHPQAMAGALARHDAIMRQAIAAEAGVVYKVIGDAFQAAFTTAPAACAAAVTAQRALAGEAWGVVGAVPVRMGLHTCAAVPTDGDYRTGALNRLGRLLGAVHGGQIVLSQSTADLAREMLPPEVALRDLGERQLRDLRPEPVFQLLAPDLPADFPPLTTLDRPRHNLPTPPTALIGRAGEIATVVALLRRAEIRLATMTGPGGIGKTRLALQVATELHDDFADGVHFVNLAPISDPGLVAATIAQALGVQERGGQPLVERLHEHLRGKLLLLVLDNFEQVVDAARLLGALLAAAPQLQALVTSREPLHLAGEHEYAVPPLRLPDPQRLPPIDRLVEYAAVQLFLARAQAVKADFGLTPENAPAVAAICQQLDGLPLAIELAAARVKLLPPHALLARLDQRLQLLTGGARDAPARQQMMRAAIAWSYDLLTPAEQGLFRRLAVFVGGWTLAAAEAAGTADGDLSIDVLDGLAALLDKSLLKPEAGATGEPRFRMLETIRAYALEQLEARGEAEAIRQRHAHFFMALAETAEPHLYGAGQQTWVRRLEVDNDNLRAALGWATHNASEIGLRLAGALGWFWHFHGDHRKGREWLLRLLERAKNDGDHLDRFRAKALNQAGYLAMWLHDLAQANALLEQSVVLWRAVGEPRGLAHALCDWGVVEFEGDLNMARVRLEESIVLFRLVDDTQGLVRALFWHGGITSRQGDFATARANAEESIRLGREIGDISNIAASTGGVLGYIAFRQGDYVVSQSHSLESLRLHREGDDRPGIALALGNLGCLAYLQGQYEQVRPLLEERLQIWRELDNQHAIAWSLYALGYLALRQNNSSQAATLFAESLALWREHGETQGMARCLAGLAAVAHAAGQLERTARLLAATQVLLEASGRPFEDTERDPTAGYPITSQAKFDLHVAAVRAALGDAAFETAWAAGQTLTLDQAVAEAQQVLLEAETTLADRQPGSPPAPPST